MGIEYQAIAAVDLPSIAISAAFRGLANRGRWAPLSSGDDSLVLRDIRQPERDRWPEDVEVRVQGRKVYVLFHSGSPDDHVQFLQELSDQFQSAGIALEFSDL
jgi:hypothetical protein